MKQPLDYYSYRPTDPKPISKEATPEATPIMAAAIVFTPIIGAVVLLICYVLLHK